MNKGLKKWESWAWNLGQKYKVFDTELFAIEKAIEKAISRIDIETTDIYIFVNSHATIKRLQNKSIKAGQKHCSKIQKIAQKINEKHIDIYIE